MRSSQLVLGQVWSQHFCDSLWSQYFHGVGMLQVMVAWCGLGTVNIQSIITVWSDKKLFFDGYLQKRQGVSH